MEAIRVYIRYEVKRDFGLPNQKETRREFNIRFGMDPGPEVELSEQGLHLWDWYWDLRRRKGASEAGPMPLEFVDITAWSSLMGEVVRREEVDILMQMDDTFLVSSQKESEADSERKKATSPAPKTPASRSRFR